MKYIEGLTTIREELTTLGEELTAIGDVLDAQYWYDKVQRMKPSPEERIERARVLRAEKEERFSEALQDYISGQIGGEYEREHKSREGTCWEKIQSHIVSLYETGIGACYSGQPGSGKTHALLEHVYQLCWREWEEYVKTTDYPPASSFIEKTIHFGYAVRMSESFEKKERIPYAKYNLIDDLGCEADSPYIEARWDDYFEEINRRGLYLVISTNMKKEDLAQIDKYKRIFSRLLAKCHFYELPAVDRRDPGKKAG